MRFRVRTLPVTMATLAAIVVPSSSLAGGWRLTVDPEKSEIRFVLGATLHKVHGSVALERGEIRFDASAGEISGQISGELVADARSATTDQGRRDRKMHEQVLESGRFPTFVFTPRRWEGALDPESASSVEIHGDLTLHGATHPLIVETRIEPGSDELLATATFSVPYVEWGLTDPSSLFLRVKKFVEVTVELIGQLQPVPSPDPP